MFTDDQIRALQGAELYDRDGAKVGTVGQVWADTAGQPAWVSVDTGRPGHHATMMPLAGASFTGSALHTAYPGAVVANAPEVDVNTEQPLDSRGLDALYAHYSLTLDDSVPGAAGTTGDDAEVIRSEERLRVSTEQEATGKVRLRKHVVTEYVTTTVPVRREELRVEHVPLDEAGAEPGPGVAESPGTPDAETETEMILYAERPVVTTETVPVERVRLGKQTVTEQQTVSGEVRKEQIEVSSQNPDDSSGDKPAR